ncbi:MAG: D-alanyl-D-alanine carboxypeptidase family protein [Sedimentibacter sp.]|uniref:D-alanyl-D-alanine carboxypeptidase family protein n=1 Tax=Sedimentibacter sp. TaxID=1960295 RepID=UPI0029828C59|nr:D-alanyl-D-alanine carboxypeptidase family protein [Sedimentibacter sp.]MDW5299859.1 D-alanyl-D-alanine carboxypeptidase family protein [Sedimentibacter sp.]
MIYKSFKVFIIFIAMTVFLCQFNYAEAIPDVAAKSYIVIDADSGRIISSRNANEKLPIASTTKIMTTILSIENADNLTQKIEVPAFSTGIEGSSIYLKPRQMVSITDLLYGTMLRSGNDAAETLAAFTGRNSQEGFVSMMNDKAVEIGAYNTCFANACGLHDDNHYSTAYDLALISKYAMRNETFKEIVSTVKYKAESLNTILYNKNKVVLEYEYGSGVKIGYTKAAGRCLVASAEKEGIEIIVVVLNDNDWFNDSYKLFDWAFENYKNYSIVEKNQYVGTASDGKPVFISDSFTYLLTEDEKNKVRFELNITTPHIVNNKNNTIYGTYNIFLKNELIHTGSLMGN